ncbi:hypothetical protein GEMRC1_003114 [Eukaryota sp. GEM-RC1]
MEPITATLNSIGNFDGVVKYTFSSGNYYIGEVVDSVFSGKGKLYTETGHFDGVFDDGKMVSGLFVFKDGLEYAETDWKYLSSDNRFFVGEQC